MNTCAPTITKKVAYLYIHGLWALFLIALSSRGLLVTTLLVFFVCCLHHLSAYVYALRAPTRPNFLYCSQIKYANVFVHESREFINSVRRVYRSSLRLHPKFDRSRPYRERTADGKFLCEDVWTWEVDKCVG